MSPLQRDPRATHKKAPRAGEVASRRSKERTPGKLFAIRGGAKRYRTPKQKQGLCQNSELFRINDLRGFRDGPHSDANCQVWTEGRVSGQLAFQCGNTGTQAWDCFLNMSQSVRAAASSATSAWSLKRRPVEVSALTTRGASPRSCALKRDVSCCHSLVAAFSLVKAPSCTPKPGSDRQALASEGETWVEAAATAAVPEALGADAAADVGVASKGWRDGWERDRSPEEACPGRGGVTWAVAPEAIDPGTSGRAGSPGAT